MKLKNALLEKVLNPLFLNSGFISPCQIQKHLQDSLPYCEIKVGTLTEESLFIDIDFHDFLFTVKFVFKPHDSINYIKQITI